jgi:hypothetical protein
VRIICVLHSLCLKAEGSLGATYTEIWQQALKMLAISIAERQSKDRTFEKSGLDGKRVFVRQAGQYQGIPNAREVARKVVL